MQAEDTVNPHSGGLPVVKVRDGDLIADSRDVASYFGRRHADVLRAIRDLECSHEFRQRNFASFKNNDLTGETTSHVEMTKNGFTLAAFGFTGAKAVAFKEGYIAQFDAMETALRARIPAGIDHGKIGRQVAAIVDEKVKAASLEIAATLLPEMVKAALAAHNLMIRRGRTAGQVYREAGFPPMKGIAGWFGNRLVRMDCAIEGHGRAEMGACTARLFDPDKAHRWLENGGRLAVERKLAERRGQGVLHLVPPVKAAPTTEAAPCL